MKANIIQIGNSRGICLPESAIKQCGFEEFVEITLRDNGLLLQPSKKTREGWEESFHKMGESGDDLILGEDSTPSHWDLEEWTWE